MIPAQQLLMRSTPNAASIGHAAMQKVRLFSRAGVGVLRPAGKGVTTRNGLEVGFVPLDPKTSRSEPYAVVSLNAHQR